MSETEQKYVVEVHASNNKWTFGKVSEGAANKIKQAFIDGRRFSIMDPKTVKDYSFNPATLVTIIIGEDESA